jgi:hypothetical protein
MQRIVKVNCSIRQVMVLAVSMMLQVPTEAEAAGKELGFGCVVAGAVLRPEATESVQAPKTSLLSWPTSMGPVQERVLASLLDPLS